MHYLGLTSKGVGTFLQVEGKDQKWGQRTGILRKNPFSNFLENSAILPPCFRHPCLLSLFKILKTIYQNGHLKWNLKLLFLRSLIKELLLLTCRTVLYFPVIFILLLFMSFLFPSFLINEWIHIHSIFLQKKKI